MIANATSPDDADIKVWKVLTVLHDLGDGRCRMGILVPQNPALFMWMDRDDLQSTRELCSCYI